MAYGRLLKELKELQKEASASPDPDIVLVPEEDNMSRWHGRIKGPESTPFEVADTQLGFCCRMRFSRITLGLLFTVLVFITVRVLPAYCSREKVVSFDSPIHSVCDENLSSKCTSKGETLRNFERDAFSLWSSNPRVSSISYLSDFKFSPSLSTTKPRRERFV